MKCKTCGNESQTEECISCMIRSTSQIGIVAKEAYDRTHGLGLDSATESLLKSFKDNDKKDELDFSTKALLESFSSNEKMHGLGLGLISENIYSNMSNIQKESFLELERKNNLEKIEKLNKKLIEEREENKKNKKLSEESNNRISTMEAEIKLIREINSQNDEVIKKFKSDEKNVKDTIEFIDKLPNKYLSELKSTLEYRIKVFNRIGFYSLLVSGLTFLGYFVSLLFSLPVPTTAVSYFNNIFFIVFPTIVAFTSYRQGNLKSEELEKINEKLLNSNYLVASLQAIQRISKESDRDILVSINKLIDSILYKKDEKKVSDDLDINEVKTTLRDAALIIKTLNK